ncbi:MAG: cytochrome c maturation protein CcmE [Dehalococcoidia bacterium]|nr:cytochrome c maturation protein CcmE [Dehalococcoidia bacterium]
MSDTAPHSEHPQSEHPQPQPLEDRKERTISSFKGRLFIGAALLVGALVYFGYTAFQGSTVYYLTVGELTMQQAGVGAKAVRVSGKLVDSSFHRDAGSTVATFTITDGQTALPAKYTGVVPDLFFNEHSDIVLQGTYGTDGVFHTDNVIVKCPSKYVAETPNVPKSEKH